LYLSSFSRVFKKESEENWTSKLKLVHSHAWETWARQYAHKRGYSLPDHLKQTPGEVSGDFIRQLAAEVSQLPPPTKYPRK
jgi:hypothetical protein